MTTQEIASRLIELCAKGEFQTAQKELFSDDAVSIEPVAEHGFEKETKGKKGILAKGEQFMAMTEKIHSISLSKPIVAANSFAVTLDMDTTMKQGGRMDMKEICLYKVADGKIISEEFFM